MDTLLEEKDEKYKSKKIAKYINEQEQLYMRDIKMEKEKASEAWRFVMIASYLLNGKEYYKQFTTPINDYPMFKHFLNREIEKSEKMGFKKYVFSVLGPNFIKYT